MPACSNRRRPGLGTALVLGGSPALPGFLGESVIRIPIQFWGAWSPRRPDSVTPHYPKALHCSQQMLNTTTGTLGSPPVGKIYTVNESSRYANAVSRCLCRWSSYVDLLLLSTRNLWRHGSLPDHGSLAAPHNAQFWLSVQFTILGKERAHTVFQARLGPRFQSYLEGTRAWQIVTREKINATERVGKARLRERAGESESAAPGAVLEVRCDRSPSGRDRHPSVRLAQGIHDRNTPCA